jgi:hypothetical protein
MPTATQALQTAEIANASAWAVYQRNVARLSLAAICALAAMEPMRREDGSYDINGGLGRPLAKSTLHRWLTEARESFRDEYLRRPLIDMVQEEDDRLEHLAAESAQVIRMSEPGSPKWQAAFDRHLRTLESRRKLLGLDQPTRIEVTAEVTTHDDPASAKLAEAMADAKRRRDELMAEVRGE